MPTILPMIVLSLRFLLFLFVPLAALGQTQDSVRNSTFEGAPAVTISNGRLKLTVTRRGATVVKLVLNDDRDKINPYWDPVRMARELGRTLQFNPGSGHFVCVDGFGPPSSEERAVGLPTHGEAHLQTFAVRSTVHASIAVVIVAAKLPIVEEFFTRTFKVVNGENVIYVDSSLENLLGFDRPVNWAEHATIGSPFLEPGVTVVDLSGVRSQTRPYKGLGNRETQRRLVSGKDFMWPIAPALSGRPIDLRQTPKHPHYLDHATTLLDPSRKLEWVTALNPQKRLVLGYIFRREDYPWLQYWGDYPLSGKLARGMEFSTQPYDVSRREAISTGSMFGVPTYRWLPAKSKIETRFLLFYAHVPDGFTNVDDVSIKNGRIVVEDRAARKQVMLSASLSSHLSS